LNEAQTQVILAEKALKVILECVTSTAAWWCPGVIIMDRGAINNIT
jgi:hypothetical protein